MDVRCEKCQTEYELDESRLKPGGVTVKCTNCGHMFKIRKRAPTNVGMPAVAAIDPRTRPVSSKQPMTGDKASSSDAPMRITDMPPEFFIAQKRLFGIPAPVYFMVILTVLMALWMHYASLGRAIYAVGGNPEAARASGLYPERVCVLAFALHGFFAGIAALLFATQLQVIQSTVPPNLELTVITASVIGGVSILGGTGTVIGSTLAAILFACISSALVFLNVSA